MGSLAALVCMALGGRAQEPSSQSSDFSRNPEWFPRILRPYRAQPVPDIRQSDEVDLASWVREGKLRLSLDQLRSAVLGNNIDIADARYGPSLAETDILRARGGGAPRGAPGVRIPSGLFAGAIGAGVGDTTTAGGGTGAGGITSSARQIFARPRGTYDPSIAFNFSLDRSTTPLNTLVVAGVPTVTTSTTALQARFAQAFTSGTSLTISFNNQRQSSTQQFLLYNPSFVSSCSLVVTQQLLNGSGFDVNRRFLTVAENGRRIAQEALREQIQTTMAQVEGLYWEAVAARENVAVAENALAVARRLYEENRQREELGTLSGIDVVTAASEVSARQRDLIAAQTALQMLEADLKNSLSRKLGPELESARIEPIDPLPDPSVEAAPDHGKAFTEALENRPELRQAEANLINQDIAVRYTRNLLKPTLVLFGLLGSAGLSGNRLLEVAPGSALLVPGGISQALRQVRSFDYPEYAFGFSFQIPIRNRSAQADNMRARLEKQQAETSLQQTRSQIALEVRNAIVSLVQTKAQAESAAKAVELRQESLRAEEERLSAGLSTPYDVIRRQRDLIRAQYDEVRARANYAKARVALTLARGAGP